MRLDDLDPLDRFILTALPDVRGQLLHLSAGAALVRYEATTFRDLDHEAATVPARSATISRSTQVTRLPYDSHL